MSKQNELLQEAKSSRPTLEEYTMVRDFVLLPHMLTMVERSTGEIKASSNILKPLYMMAAKAVSNQIHKDMTTIRRELAKRSIKVIDDGQVDLVIYYKIICRGYEERFGIMRDVARSEISVRLSNYLKDVAKLIEK